MANTSFTFSDELKARIEPLLVANESISQFAHRATEEKVNRMEARDERARKALMARDKKVLKPIFKELMEEINAESM
jgi:hypothetical protein